MILKVVCLVEGNFAKRNDSFSDYQRMYPVWVLL